MDQTVGVKLGISAFRLIFAEVFGAAFVIIADNGAPRHSPYRQSQPWAWSSHCEGSMPIPSLSITRTFQGLYFVRCSGFATAGI